MKTAILILAALATLPVQASTARIADAQQALKFDLYACPRPDYPPAALALGVGGTVKVELRVGAAGEVSDARVVSSTGRADLDEAALAGIRKCAFHVVLATGQAPTGWLKTQFAWRPGATRLAPDALFAGTNALAEQGDAAAQNRLGTWYEHGTYVDKDMTQAAAWYRKAAEGGNAFAQNNLGVLYNRGNGVPRDTRQAAYWYAKAGAQGHGWAQANLAWAYLHGSAGEGDKEKALAWLTRSAEGGLAPAQVRLGLLLLDRAVSDDERAAAVAWLARAAAQGDPAGHYYLGRSFELGLGNTQDDAQAAEAYRNAVGRSGGRAETALGVLLDAGRIDAIDMVDAPTLYERAMASRHPAAFYRYGLALEQDGESVLAAALFRQGAELGGCESAIKLLQRRIAEDPGSETARRYKIVPQPEGCSGRLESEPQF